MSLRHLRTAFITSVVLSSAAFSAASEVAVLAQLPSVQSVADVPAGAWWVRVDDMFFHSPSATSGLSTDISNYWVAMGRRHALEGSLESSRVGGNGQWHIFYMPNGLANPRAPLKAGPRLHAVSSATPLQSGQEFKADFPAYVVSANYQSPWDSWTERRIEKKLVKKIKTGKTLTLLRNLIGAANSRNQYNSGGTAKAVSFIKKEMKKAKIGKVCVHKFSTWSFDAKNVVGYIPGECEQCGSITLGAHYDSLPQSGAAPGANDNGSGTAAVLAIMQAFGAMKITPKVPIYFVAFGAEEQGLHGSSAFVDALKDGSLPTKCQPSAGLGGSSADHKSIIMDMIGWKSPSLATRTVNLESYDGNEVVLDALKSVQVDQNIPLSIIHSNYPFGSDHMSWLNEDYQSALTIHGDDTSYPAYHSSTDTIEYIDKKLQGYIARMNGGALLRLAGLAGSRRLTGSEAKSQRDYVRLV